MKSRWAMRSRLRAEGGWLVATAIILMTLMMGMGLATYAIVDTQTALSGVERQRESSFNLGESALNAQAFSLSRRWPGAATNAYPASCTWTTGQTVSLDDRCPSASELERAFDTADYGSGTSWTVTVRDDDGEQFYDESEIVDNPTWDANDNDTLWVRADAVVRGRSRALVALVSVDSVTESFPRKAVVAGSIEVGPSGNQTYVKTEGQDVALRCSEAEGSSCADYKKKKKSSQIDPEESIKYGQYVDEPVLSPAAVDRLRAFAQASGTYYTSCPPSPAGEVVFVEPPASSTPKCEYNASGKNDFNSPSDPGLFILTRGTFNIHANDAYYGIVYALNGQGSTETVVSTGGGGEIHGAVFIDGPGKLTVGSSSPNVIFDQSAFEGITSYGTAGVVQNTWREVPSP